jgi:hypothetical protein
VNLFLQALTTFDVLHHVISRATTFFSHRKPYELGSFSWIVDGKDPANQAQSPTCFDCSGRQASYSRIEKAPEWEPFMVPTP